MGACAEHGYYAGDCCDRCYPLRVCDECASLREEAEMFKERWELEQIRYEGISAANEALRARVAVLEQAVEWAKSTGGAIHDDQISSWLCELDRRAKEGK